jgi:hypothetical protein
MARLQQQHAPSPTSAGGTRDILPAPGAAVITAARPSVRAHDRGKIRIDRQRRARTEHN